MCGICGSINLDGRPQARDLIVGMRDAMVHRGPDDEGLFVEGPVGLGHRRLSIIDLHGGRQPISNEDGSVTIVFNGEIYNFDDLRRDLESRGHRFTTRSDTEVIVHLYEEKGPSCLEDLRGMFAFAIWDAKKRTLLLARDRLGIKPLYYHHRGGDFLFASEIKALLTHPALTPALSERGLRRFLRYRFVYGEATMFEGVSELPPGHYMVVSEKGVERRRYWDVSFAKKTRSRLGTLAEELMEILEESVRLRMISDVPVGVFLSGGVDSSAVAALMKRNSEGIKTFSIGFKPEEQNELRFADSVAGMLGAEHHEYLLGSDDFFGLLKKLIRHHDEPMIFPASIPLYILSRHSKDNATVMLAGEGADEIFTGYDTNVRACWLNRLSSVVPRGAGGLLASLPLPARYRAIAAKTALDERELITSFFAMTGSDGLGGGAGGEAPGVEDDLELWGEIGFDGASGTFLDKLIYFQLKTYLVALLMKQDKMSMAASIETRVPFLDHRLVEFACTLPDRYRVRLKHGKYLLKRSLEGCLPDGIIYRKKMGFPVPIERWFREKDNPFMEVLLDESTKRDGFIDHRFVERAVERFRAGRPGSTQAIWALINLELWRRVFFEESAPATLPARAVEP